MQQQQYLIVQTWQPGSNPDPKPNPKPDTCEGLELIRKWRGGMAVVWRAGLTAW